MPFGLKNAGATFVRAVRSILRPIRSFADSYVDDMGVGSYEWGSHVVHVRKFLELMREAGMTLNLAKCWPSVSLLNLRLSLWDGW